MLSMLPVASTDLSMPAPSLPSPVVFPSYAFPSACTTESRDFPVPADTSMASLSASVAPAVSPIERTRRSNAGRSASSATPVSRWSASIMPSTCVVSCASPRLSSVLASFAAAASSSTNALTPSTPNCTAAYPAAAPAPMRAGPSIPDRVLLRLRVAFPNRPRSCSAPLSAGLNFLRSAARYTVSVRLTTCPYSISSR